MSSNLASTFGRQCQRSRVGTLPRKVTAIRFNHGFLLAFSHRETDSNTTFRNMQAPSTLDKYKACL